MVDYDNENQIEQVRLVFNRSKEVANYAIEKTEKEEDRETGIPCVFVSPRENIIWLLAEELKHAQIWLKAGSKEREAGWQSNYKEVLKRKGRSFGPGYARDLQEVAVSRSALRILSKLVPERANYFEGLRQKSLQTGRNVTPNIKKTADETYIETGFRVDESKTE